MRLIDAEKLKYAIMTKTGVAEETWDQLYDSVLEEIDNAPTVDKVINVYPSGEVIVQEKRPQGETNAEIFQQTFGIYATELWSMKEADFLKWLNAEQD